jgi:hypothetical protein
MQDKPANYPTTQPNGEPLKPITQLLLERRATKPIPDALALTASFTANATERNGKNSGDSGVERHKLFLTS